MSKKIDLALLEEAAMWAARRAEGGLRADDEASFGTWLSSPSHADALEAVDVALFSLADAANAPELLAMRGAAIERARRSGAARWVSAAATGTRALLAAALLVAAAGGALIWALMPASYATGVGERQVVTLQDGSRVSLDAATEVKARFTDSRRELWLEHGRAKFDVAHDPLHPFMVTAAGRTIVATGTSFSVELVNGQMRVILYEGSVDVVDGARERTGAKASTVQKLAPGQEMIASIGARAAASTVAVDPARSRLWEGGQLVFDDEPLTIAVERVNRYAKAPIKLGGRFAGRLRVSGVFNAGDTDAFLDGIAALLPLRVEQKEGEIVVHADLPATSSERGGASSVP